MADTEFSGDLMGCDGVACNPCYLQVTKVVKHLTIPAVTDMTVVDYLVHGKDVMKQVFDVSIGDLPYHTVEEDEKKRVCEEGKAWHFAPNPKWYSSKKWKEMQYALKHSAPACCSIPNTPDYKIIHTSPTPNPHKFRVVHIAPEHIKSVEFEVPEPMIELTPLTIELISEMVFKSPSEQPEEAFVAKQNGEFAGLDVCETMNAKLEIAEKMIGGDLGKDIESNYALLISSVCAHLDAQIAEEQELTGKRPQRINWSYVAKSHRHKEALGCCDDRFPDPTGKKQFRGAYIIATDSMGCTGIYVNRLVDMIMQSRNNLKRAIDTGDDITYLKSLLTNDPQFAKEIAEKAGWSVQKVSKLLKTAEKAGVVKSMPRKNSNRKTLPAYFV